MLWLGFMWSGKEFGHMRVFKRRLPLSVCCEGCFPK